MRGVLPRLIASGVVSEDEIAIEELTEQFAAGGGGISQSNRVRSTDVRLDSRIGAHERIEGTRVRGACGLDRRDWLPPDTFAMDRGDPKQLARQALHSSLAKLYLCHSSATGARKSAIRPQRDRCIDYWTPLLHASDAQKSSHH